MAPRISKKGFFHDGKLNLSSEGYISFGKYVWKLEKKHEEHWFILTKLQDNKKRLGNKI